MTSSTITISIGPTATDVTTTAPTAITWTIIGTAAATATTTTTTTTTTGIRTTTI